MTDRVLDLSERATWLSVRGELLVIQPEEQPEVTIPLAEMAVVVASHPQVSFSHPVLAAIAKSGGVVVVCAPNHLPVGMLMPLEGHFVQAERFAMQAQTALPVRKQLWKQIIQAKITAQGRLLQRLHGDDQGLLSLADKVKSDDGGNLEARAARTYWAALFRDPEFSRQREGEDQNRYLNYGYAVLRATVARAICAAGLHPSLGLHHHNRYDAFCLADDLMEPLRPWVDTAVVKVVEDFGATAPMSKELKAALLAPLLGRLNLNGEERTLFDITHRMAGSLVEVLEGKRKKLHLPEG